MTLITLLRRNQKRLHGRLLGACSKMPYSISGQDLRAVVMRSGISDRRLAWQLPIIQCTKEAWSYKIYPKIGTVGSFWKTIVEIGAKDISLVNSRRGSKRHLD